jgi:hypothetical protein
MIELLRHASANEPERIRLNHHHGSCQGSPSPERPHSNSAKRQN